MDKMSDKVKFCLEQEEKLVNRAALKSWIANGCPFEEAEEDLRFKESCEREAREREACRAHENGISIAYSTNSRSAGTRSNSVRCGERGDGSEIYASDRTGTKATDFRNNKHCSEGFRSEEVSNIVKVSNGNDKKFGSTKSVKRSYCSEQEFHYERI
ncbi:hypothetical protein C1645_730964 [Glomus cerebriforme]|uniref:Uncharacterized protein n=1 Tax=Glomus cerebriforme TaxID=658196 RepID=A0A397TN28_9GLOM|nr:hypothetical protein C1645_730964 [Glomus cerebriforme]